jgi:hypothetical protein
LPDIRYSKGKHAMRKISVIAVGVTIILSAFSAVVAGASGPDTMSGFHPAAPAAGAPPKSIPVLDWHELNNGCASTVAVCNASDPESVSTAQLTAELAYLKMQSFHTITPAEYMAWTKGDRSNLPTNPILLVADNGIENFLAGAQPILKSDGFTMAVAVVSGFADGASGSCPEPTYEPGCPTANDNGWDATWTQLRALSPSVYDFILEAGPAGHFVQTYDPNCTAFYACMVPGETSTAYEVRVSADLTTGESEIVKNLGPSRFTAGVWVVPYSDDGYTACTQTNCTPQPYDGSAGWLTAATASAFPVAFVEDAFRNGLQNERFRIDVQGWMSESEFESALTQDVDAGDFTLTNTPATTPLPNPPPPPPTSTNPVASIPVLSLDSTTMSATQIEGELAYLQAEGYNSISAATYVSWAADSVVALPANPILLTVTGGDNVVLEAITPYLYSDGYSAVDFVSTQQADAGGGSATWTQLSLLNSAAWQFSFSSGAAGGSLVATDPTTCNIYYACEAPGETATTFENRVTNEIGSGRTELDNDLWMQTVNDSLWMAPFDDAGQSGAEYNGPAGWLSLWASWVFPVIFVTGGAGADNEHYVLELNGDTSEATFQATLASDLASGMFSG